MSKHHTNFFKKLKDDATNLVKKGVMTVEEVPFAPLLPFKNMMIKQLDAHGISHTGYLHDIAPKFISEIVHKK